MAFRLLTRYTTLAWYQIPFALALGPSTCYRLTVLDFDGWISAYSLLSFHIFALQPKALLRAASLSSLTSRIWCWNRWHMLINNDRVPLTLHWKFLIQYATHCHGIMVRQNTVRVVLGLLHVHSNQSYSRYPGQLHLLLKIFSESEVNDILEVD